MASKAQQLAGRLSIDPDALEPPAAPAPAPVVAPTPVVAPAPVAVERESDPEPDRPRRSTASPRRRRREARTTPRAGGTALDDPQFKPGTSDYRSFYIDDGIYARFRAAVFYSSRHLDADDDVPENMSSAVEDWMDTTASELERRFNQGKVFPMPPTKSKRTSRKGEG